MTTPNVDLDVLRESQDRALHREGIPMLVVLSDEREGFAEMAATGIQSDGQRLAGRVDAYRASLASAQRDSDMGVLISVLAVTAYEDFDRSVTA